uniref:Dipeptidyl peptidase 3 n=1 Tax=Acrobeloides nanus TaxID=290746 RepID=A0A914E4I0_9BILA
MAPIVDKKLYVLQNDTPVVPLDCKKAFEMLTPREKSYAHHIARASFEGGLITFCQVSPEAPAIFAILHRVFYSEPIDALKQKAKDLGWSDEEFTSLLVYAAGFYADHGNYKGFGDSKIIPNVDQAKLRQLFEKSVAFEKEPTLLKLYNKIEHRIFSLEPKHLSLGFPEEGVTTYFSSNVTKDDAELVRSFLKENNLEGWNTRLEKRQEGTKTIFIIRLASIPQAQNEIFTKEFEGATFIVKNGDYGHILENVIPELAKAKDFVANENQLHMIEKYIEHFTTGDINAHKDGSRYWIKDINPAIESYIGFIENYRDPDGFRSEFEGFVTAVNKETSQKFQVLVERAEELIQRLPWGAGYEKDKFLKPDFTSLDVIGFAGSGLPAGINIPNYDEIRQNEGFKNVSLGNVIAAIPKQKVEFLSAEDEELFKKYYVESFEVQVGLHELLGHGSGKLLMRDEDGKLNFDKENVKDMLTGGEITSWYEKGETWGSKFGQLSSAYEECRAEAVGYFLSCYEDILKIFGHEGEVAQTVKYVNWLNEIRAGLVGLEYYLLDSEKWGQAHCCARYVLLRVAMAAGQGFVTIEEVTGEDGKPDLKFRLDRTKIDSVGKPAIGEFLKQLQYYKATANAVEGTKFYNQWAAVGPEQKRWREIVVARRKPRRVYVQPNTVLEANGEVSLKNYQENYEGMIQSFVERYNKESIDAMLKVWENDLPMFDL